MQFFLFGRAFPAIVMTALAFACAPTAATAQAVAADAPTLADTETGEAENAEVGGFVLVEHRLPVRSAHSQIAAFSRPATPTRTASFNAASPTPIRASSAARDRVLVHIKAAEVRHRLPSGLLDALVAAESNYRQFAVSRAGAAGLAQLMPATARSLGVSDRFDVRANLDGGARYLRSMIDRFGSISIALAAYNAGPGAVTRARGIPQNGETPSYVARVLQYWHSLWR